MSCQGGDAPTRRLLPPPPSLAEGAAGMPGTATAADLRGCSACWTPRQPALRGRLPGACRRARLVWRSDSAPQSASQLPPSLPAPSPSPLLLPGLNEAAGGACRHDATAARPDRVAATSSSFVAVWPTGMQPTAFILHPHFRPRCTSLAETNEARSLTLATLRAPAPTCLAHPLSLFMH